MHRKALRGPLRMLQPQGDAPEGEGRLLRMLQPQVIHRKAHRGPLRMLQPQGVKPEGAQRAAENAAATGW